TFNNTSIGTMNVTTTSGFGIDSDGVGVNALNNAGTLNWATAPYSVPISVVAFTNSATVNVNSGTLNLTSSGTDSGQYVVASGSGLNFNGTRSWTGTAVLNATSAGTVNVSGALSIDATNTIPASLAGFNLQS